MHPLYFLWKAFFILAILEIANSSKLNQIVLQSSEDIFNQSEQSKGSSLWQNEGFIMANATEISDSFGYTVNGSSHLLLATKSASLTTQLKDFDHTFLSIKFFSIIGRWIPDTKAQVSPTEAPSTTPTTVVSTTTEPTTTTTTTKASITKSILKLNTDSTDGHVIEISIDHPASSPVGQPSPEKIADPVVKQSRRKRTLNSEEISQIHKIISNTVKKGDGKPENKSHDKKNDKGERKIKMHVPEPIIGSPSAPTVNTKSQTGSGKNTQISKPKKLPYETWKASMDKSFRPPGFYVTADDKVIFDNWIGVWQSPSVMGRWIPPARKKVWNETELLLQFDEDPDQDVKISFEWEPADAYSYLFLSNITISTYGANYTVKNILINSTSPEYSLGNLSSPNTISGIGGNKNITLYIVVKSQQAQSVENKHIPFSLDTNEPEEDTGSITADDQAPQLSKKSSANGESKLKAKDDNEESGKSKSDDSTGVKGDSNSNESVRSKTEGKVVKSSGTQTGFIVACVTGLLSFFILGALIHKKMQLSKRQGRGC